MRGLSRVSAFAVAIFASGCLGTAYRVPRRELIRLSETPAEQRGNQVRVIQGFAGDDGPPPAPGVHGHTTVVVYGGGGVRGGGPRNVAGLGKAASKADDSKAWLILAGIAAVGLAATEGARFDGWARLHPMHPVHIYGPNGEYSWVPLAQLDPNTAMWARKAFVRETEGPWTPLERAPLNRVGFTYSLLLGSAEIPSAQERSLSMGTDPANAGFIGHIQLGLFPTQQVGLLLDFGMGWRNNAFGDTVFEGRNALELQFLPVSAGIFHAGVYGQGGLALRLEDGAKSSEQRSFLLGGGGLLQLELTTRLTITARGGYVRILGEDTAEVAVGVSIY
jgi:hypothetical protein